MRIRYINPYATDGNLAAAMNYEMSIAPKDSYIAFCDRDIWWPHPEYGHQIHEIIETHGEAFYTCYTNRINTKWQRIPFIGDDNDAVKFAKVLYDLNEMDVEDHTDSSLWSGFVMIAPVNKWIPIEHDHILGLDNQIHLMAKQQNCKVKLMKGVFCWHYYSGFEGRSGHKLRDKSHLK